MSAPTNRRTDGSVNATGDFSGKGNSGRAAHDQPARIDSRTDIERLRFGVGFWHYTVLVLLILWDRRVWIRVVQSAHVHACAEHPSDPFILSRIEPLAN
jgi:hypothetical protein